MIFDDGDPGDEQEKKECSICGEPLEDSDLYICGECVAAELREDEERDPRGNER